MSLELQAAGMMIKRKVKKWCVQRQRCGRHSYCNKLTKFPIDEGKTTTTQMNTVRNNSLL